MESDVLDPVAQTRPRSERERLGHRMPARGPGGSQSPGRTRASSRSGRSTIPSDSSRSPRPSCLPPPGHRRDCPTGRTTRAPTTRHAAPASRRRDLPGRQVGPARRERGEAGAACRVVGALVVRPVGQSRRCPGGGSSKAAAVASYRKGLSIDRKLEALVRPGDCERPGPCAGMRWPSRSRSLRGQVCATGSRTPSPPG